MLNVIIVIKSEMFLISLEIDWQQLYQTFYRVLPFVLILLNSYCTKCLMMFYVYYGYEIRESLF